MEILWDTYYIIVTSHSAISRNAVFFLVPFFALGGDPLYNEKKSFQIFQKEFFSNSTSFLLKKSYIPSNIAPFNYPGTLRVIGPGSGPGPGNGKSQKTGSGPGTPLPSISGYPGNSLPGPTLQDKHNISEEFQLDS